MTVRTPPRVALLFAKLLPRECEPLVGDLVEGYQAGYSRRWFWTQVLYAVMTYGAYRPDAEHQRLAALRDATAKVAIVTVVAFEAIVAATLLDRVLGSPVVAWVSAMTSLGREGLVWVAPLAALVATWLLTRTAPVRGPFVVLSIGATAALAAILTLYAVHPVVPRPFLPAPGRQMGTAFVLACSLLGLLRPRRTQA